jgi:hypothetical protein
MLTSKIEKQNTVININIKISIASVTRRISVYLNKDTGYLSILGIPNSNTGQYSSISQLWISDTFNQPIILPESLEYLNINGEFNQPIILPNQIYWLSINGEFNQSIILPNNLETLEISGKFNQPIILPDSIRLLRLDGEFQ